MQHITLRKPKPAPVEAAPEVVEKAEPTISKSEQKRRDYRAQYTHSDPQAEAAPVEATPLDVPAEDK